MPRNPPPISPLLNPVRNYAWGSYDGLSTYAGVPQDRDKPTAEYWMGAHPNAPSILLLPGGGRLALDKYIADQPIKALGDEVFSEFGELPFLFKVLSASMPLSIQVHPDKAKAEAGYDREEAMGIGMSQSERDYRDRNHKPELALALSDFSALCGFREAREIAELLGPELSDFFSFSAERGQESLRALISKALSLKEKERFALERLVDARARVLAKSSNEAARLAGETVLFCYAHYPHDPGALSPLFLKVLTLRPGQAIYIPAGVMHAYFSGTILEIMASSDNVIRGGLTQKHIDVGELLATLDFSASPSLVEAKMAIEACSLAWESPAKEFSLSRIDLGGGPPLSMKTRGPEILLCTEGSGKIVASGDATCECTLRRGDSAFVAACCGAYSLSGSGKIYRACTGLDEGAEA